MYFFKLLMHTVKLSSELVEVMTQPTAGYEAMYFPSLCSEQTLNRCQFRGQKSNSLDCAHWHKVPLGGIVLFH